MIRFGIPDDPIFVPFDIGPAFPVLVHEYVKAIPDNDKGNHVKEVPDSDKRNYEKAVSDNDKG
jgi:hypothetical protein